MSDMLIGEVAQKTGMPASTIRYYESIELIPLPQRKNGRRRYDANVIRHLALIRAAQNTGWSLSEIRELFLGFPDHASLSERWRARAPQKIDELDTIIAQTEKMKQMLEQSTDCRCKTIDECIIVSFI